MNIGIFTDSYFPQVSGVSTSIYTLKNKLIAEGHQVTVFTTTDPKADFDPSIIRLPSVPFISFTDRRVAFGGFRRCLKIAKKRKLDLIHTHTEFSLGMLGKYIASQLNIPTIHTYHTMYENYTHYILRGKLVNASHVRLYSRIFCNHTCGVIAPSQLTLDTLRSYGVTVPMRVIPTGVEIPEFDPSQRRAMRQDLGLAEEDFVLLSLSRLSKEKAIDQVIDQFAQIQAQLPQAALVIAGDGPARADLEQQAQRLGLDRVKFIGEVPHAQVASYYQMADLYLNASQSESQGLTYLEAFANRLPIVALRNDYLVSVMQSPNYGCLCDTPQEMGSAVLQLKQAQETGELSRLAAEDLYPLSADKFAADVVDFYQAVVSDFQPSYNIFDRALLNIRDVFSDLLAAGAEDNVDRVASMVDYLDRWLQEIQQNDDSQAGRPEE